MTTISVDDNVLSSLKREKAICELAIQNLREKCHTFEARYEMSTEEFLIKFNDGELGDKEDLFEWYALSQGLKDWEMQHTSLNKIVL